MKKIYSLSIITGLLLGSLTTLSAQAIPCEFKMVDYDGGATLNFEADCKDKPSCEKVKDAVSINKREIVYSNINEIGKYNCKLKNRDL